MGTITWEPLFQGLSIGKKIKEFGWWLCVKRECSHTDVFSFLHGICSRHMLFGGYPKASQIFFPKKWSWAWLFYVLLWVGSFFLWSDTISSGHMSQPWPHCTLCSGTLDSKPFRCTHLAIAIPTAVPRHCEEMGVWLGCRAFILHLQVKSASLWNPSGKSCYIAVWFCCLL